MLVLARKESQKLIINDNIEITVLDVTGGVVKLGVKAPLDVQIYREEIYKEIQNNNKGAVSSDVELVETLALGESFDLVSGLCKDTAKPK